VNFRKAEPPPLVDEQNSVPPGLLSEGPLLRQEALDGALLSALDPAGQDQEQQLPWLTLRLYVPPDAR
jgi:hypothetical protein